MSERASTLMGISRMIIITIMIVSYDGNVGENMVFMVSEDEQDLMIMIVSPPY